MAVTFCGQALDAHERALIGEVVATCRGVGRSELAHTVCELLEWRRPNGRLKWRECFALLEQLEEGGELELPARRATKPKGARTTVPHSMRGEAPGERLCAPLGALTPLTLTRVESPEQHRLWRELVGRYHYQGHAVAFGALLRYLIGVSRTRPQLIGCPYAPPRVPLQGQHRQASGTHARAVRPATDSDR